MKFGPFSKASADTIEELLNQKQIVFERTHSEAHVEAWRAQVRQREASEYPSPISIENCYFEISEPELIRLAGGLEHNGIVMAGDGLRELDVPEEYLCLKCDFISENQQLCPVHKIPLVTFSVKVQWQRDQSDGRWRVGKFFFLAFLGLVGIYIALSTFGWV